ncbi:MAG TPA: rhomboid family intramembrane serine protease [Planococcus sp. (in: firmicutes)]|nr:rhomboid family intramembrane serine protease [Planococcus sp. (in: firmicutes)]
MFIRRESFSEYLKFYPVVSTLIAINLLVHILTWIPVLGDYLYYYGMGSNLLIEAGEWWRFATPVFLHAGLMHLLFNMGALFLFGPELEKLAGKVRFITIYAMAGLFASAATYFLQPLNYLHVGASGAIFGIFGAYGALLYHGRRSMPELKQIILPIIIIAVVMTFLTPNVNATAHIGGLITGFLIGLSYFHPKRIISWKRKR